MAETAVMAGEGLREALAAAACFSASSLAFFAFFSSKISSRVRTWGRDAVAFPLAVRGLSTGNLCFLCFIGDTAPFAPSVGADAGVGA